VDQVVLVRHGETEWSREGRHTGRTDEPLTERGRAEAVAVGVELTGRDYALVLTSPLSRARETCRLAGFGAVAQVRDELVEWDYGAYDGLTTSEIRAERPGWTVWADGVVGGESIDEVAERADAVIAEVRAAAGDSLLFSHGQFLRILAARWLGLDPAAGRLLALDPATVSVLGWEHEWTVIREWNALCEPGELDVPGPDEAEPVQRELRVDRADRP
jgi:broad specificity phosphatase PhoE